MTSPRRELADDSEIRSFWNWFSTIAADLAEANFEDQQLIDELDRRVAGLGDVVWEIGPGLGEENALVITPDGKKEMLAATRHIVSLAPAVPAWEFHPARPVKRWDLRFTIGALEIDAREWKYALLRLADGTFEIVLEQRNLSGVGEAERYMAATIVLDGLLGEEKRLQLISEIDPVERLPDEYRERASSLKFIAPHLESIVSQ